MARPDKAAAVAELTDEFRTSNAAVLTEYRGLTVKQLQELRRALGENASYAVVKNTLTKIAAREAGVEGFDDLLVGPSAIAFVKGDPVEAAKSLRDFAKANSPLVIKGGVLDGKPLTPAEIAKIADLESREVLLARLAGALLASLQDAVSLFNAPLSQAARLVGALQSKAEQDPSILGGGAGEPVLSEDTATANEAVDETAVSEDTSAVSTDEVDGTLVSETTGAPAAAETTDAPAADGSTDAPAIKTVTDDLPIGEPAADTSTDDTVAAAAETTEG
ncbi:MAG: 50S ribosomal protein L10 [Nocardioidaceae bacterium]|nr:50S ribosomal protein L10 [Nocardioidaceae bacterium]